jgi:DNA-damage-inducible protein D
MLSSLGQNIFDFKEFNYKGFKPTSDRARNYWKVLKNRLLKEGNETVNNCNQLKLQAEDGKMRLTDVGDVEQIFRLVQSIPSPKAAPFKQ